MTVSNYLNSMGLIKPYTSTLIYPHLLYIYAFLALDPHHQSGLVPCGSFRQRYFGHFSVFSAVERF